MKNIFTLTFALALAASAETVKTATQPWVRSYVATNHTDITGKADATNVYTKAETDAKIVELAPQPGNYATVSNRAMTALQSHQSLQPAMDYTDMATNSVIKESAAMVAPVAEAVSNKLDGTSAYPEWNENIPYFQVGRIVFYKGRLWKNTNITFHGPPPGTSGSVWTDMNVNIENLKQDTLPYPTNAIPYAVIADGPDFAAIAIDAAETVVREKSLGGIWDQQLEVWWTPVMVNGALTYQATTNVNLNAEGN